MLPLGGESVIGFKRVYKAIDLLLPYPSNILNTEVVKDVATIMYALGGLDAAGRLDGTRSSVQVAKRVRDLKERFEKEREGK